MHVVITPRHENRTVIWSQIVDGSTKPWFSSNWCPRLCITDDYYPEAVQPLHIHFRQLTAKACRICDAQAQWPFDNNAALIDHMMTEHSRCLCLVFLEVTIPDIVHNQTIQPCYPPFHCLHDKTTVPVLDICSHRKLLCCCLWYAC